MDIGGVTLNSKAVMAPIAGVTDAPFRRIVMEYGAGMVYSELLSANAIVRDSAKTLKMLPSADEKGPVAVQIFGGDPAVLAEAARIVNDGRIDLLDLNFGCPVKKVTKTGGGAAALKDVDKAELTVREVVKASNRPVTVKIRAGWDSKSVNAVEIAKAAEAAGAAAVAVHGRTASQGYSGKADWRVIEKVAEAVKIPVIGNGDIASPEQAAERLRTSGCAFVMIGRAAIGTPWIFRQFNDYMSDGNYAKITRAETEAVILRHFEMLTELYGEWPAVRKMRNRLGYYSKGFPGAANFRAEANNAESGARMRNVIESFFSGANMNTQDRIEENEQTNFQGI